MRTSCKAHLITVDSNYVTFVHLSNSKNNSEQQRRNYNVPYLYTLQRLYFVESLQKTLVHKNTYTKNKFSMGVYLIHTTKIQKKRTIANIP